MKFGQDFWFWVMLVYEILKALLVTKPPDPNPGLTAGHRMFNAAIGTLVAQNEDDKKTAADLKALDRK